jgi:hypothetical protein
VSTGKVDVPASISCAIVRLQPCGQFSLGDTVCTIRRGIESRHHGNERSHGEATCCGHLYDMIEGNLVMAAWPSGPPRPHPLAACNHVACEPVAAGC